MIRVYDQKNSKGGYILQALSCTVSEQAGGKYDCNITMPIKNGDDRWKYLLPGNILDVPVPPTHVEAFNLGEISYWTVKSGITTGLYDIVSDSVTTLYPEAELDTHYNVGVRVTYAEGQDRKYTHYPDQYDDIDPMSYYQIGDTFDVIQTIESFENSDRPWTGTQNIGFYTAIEACSARLIDKLPEGTLFAKLADYGPMMAKIKTLDGKTGYILKKNIEYTSVSPGVISFLQDAQDASTAPNTQAMFAVAVRAHSAVTYQWQVKTSSTADWINTSLSGNKKQVLKFNALSGFNNRRYRCMVTDSDGNVVYSYPALLQVSNEYDPQEEFDVKESIIVPNYDVAARDIVRQDFRIDSVTINTSAMTVMAHAQHISYDYSQTCIGECVIKISTAASAINIMNQSLISASAAEVLVGINQNITDVNWTYKSVINSLLDPDSGLVSLCKSRIIRDNLEVCVLDNTEETAKIRLAYGVNLIGVDWSRNISSLCTRIIPVAKDIDGDEMLLPEVHVDSDNAGDYSIYYTQVLDTGLQVGQEMEQIDGSVIVLTEADVIALMRERAQARFAAGVDKQKITLRVNFLLLGDTEEYKQYKGLQKLQLYDWVLIEDETIDLSEVAQVTGYTWDAIAEQLTGITLGNAFDYGDRTVTGYDMGTRSIDVRALSPDLRAKLGI